MPRPDPAIDLTDAERRDLIALIQAGKPLPEKYRFVLFEDKREVELVWNGKTRDVCTTVLPFQTLEHVDGSRPETKTSPQAELVFSKSKAGVVSREALTNAGPDLVDDLAADFDYGSRSNDTMGIVPVNGG